MKNNIKLCSNQIIIYVANYFLVPNILNYLKQGKTILIIFLILINPVISTIIGYVVSSKNKYSFISASLPFVVFILSIFLFYNRSALYYGVFYVLANIIGFLLARLKK